MTKALTERSRLVRETKRAFREGDVDRVIQTGPGSYRAWELERELELHLAPPCSSCGGRCIGGDDGLWRCLKCGDEWSEDHHPVYA